MSGFVRVAVVVPALALTVGGVTFAVMPASAQQRPPDVLTVTSSSHARAGSAEAVVERTVRGAGVDLFVRAVGSPRAGITVVILSGGPGFVQRATCARSSRCWPPTRSGW
jgi:hypothetical protein